MYILALGVSGGEPDPGALYEFTGERPRSYMVIGKRGHWSVAKLRVKTVIEKVELLDHGKGRLWKLHVA